jgi:hypothetical protein
MSPISISARGGQPISPPLQGLKHFLTRSDIELVPACNSDTPDVTRDPRVIASRGIDLPNAQLERLIQYRRAVFPIVPTRSVRTAQERTNLGIDITILRGLFRKLCERIERGALDWGAKIGVNLGRVLDKCKVGKPFELTITDTTVG